MHTKQTVRYICECYPSGNIYYFKQELITHDSWQNPQSIQWSARRPISGRTFYQKKKEGFKIMQSYINKKPADILLFSKTE